jgi:hypothetical protein
VLIVPGLFQKHSKVSARGETLALAEWRLLVMSTKSRRLQKAKTEQSAEEFQILFATYHQLDYGEVIWVERDHVLVTGDSSDAGLPAWRQRFSNSWPKDIGVIAISLLEAAVLAHGLLEQICQCLINRFE